MRRNEREITQIIDIEDIIKHSDVCRIALADHNTPYIVTMNFGAEGSPVKRLYFHCAPAGRKLEMLSKNNHVCFEMDTDHVIYQGERGCDWGMRYRSIIGYGEISILNDKDSRKKAMNCIMEHYGGKNEYIYDEKVLERTVILMLEITEMTAKKC